MGVIEHVERPFVIADLGERAAIGAEQAAMLRVLDRGLFEHGNGLRALTIGPQRPGIIDHRFGVVGIGAVALRPRQRRGPIGTPARRGDSRRGGRLRRLCRLCRVATGKRDRERTHEHDRREALNGGHRFGTDRATHYGPVRPPDGFRQ
jgi:hypothetical protein